MNDEITNINWIKNLKVNDKVYIKLGGLKMIGYHLTRVKSITSDGHIITTNGALFKNGYHELGYIFLSNLEEWTEEFENELKTFEIDYYHIEVTKDDGIELTGDKTMNNDELKKEYSLTDQDIDELNDLFYNISGDKKIDIEDYPVSQNAGKLIIDTLIEIANSVPEK